MSLHSNSIFWSRIQSRFMAVLLSLSSGVSSNQEQASRFFLFFFFMTLTFWSIQANWFWRMSSILKLSDCFMIRSELNTLAEDARCCYCTLPPHHASSSSHRGPITLTFTLVTFLRWYLPNRFKARMYFPFVKSEQYMSGPLSLCGSQVLQ